jgi:hypothetical protein
VTWLQFKELVEAQGVKDDHEVRSIEVELSEWLPRAWLPSDEHDYVAICDSHEEVHYPEPEPGELGLDGFWLVAFDEDLPGDVRFEEEDPSFTEEDE